MTIEKILKDNIKSMNKTYPPLRLRRIALLEMQGKSSFFLNQIVSQGLMHMYICISSIIIIIIYVLNSIYYNYYKHSMFNVEFILLCILLVILSNAYYAKHIFEVSMNTLNTLEDKSSDEHIEIQ